jgi:hypothetical protein
MFVKTQSVVKQSSLLCYLHIWGIKYKNSKLAYLLQLKVGKYWEVRNLHIGK